MRVLENADGESELVPGRRDGEPLRTWIVMMSSRLKTESSSRSLHDLVLMHSRSTESYANTFPVDAMKTMCE